MNDILQSVGGNLIDQTVKTTNITALSKANVDRPHLLYDSAYVAALPFALPFVGFPKISRLSRPVIITEKIDGTNAQIYITNDDGFLVGSRNRYLSLREDNHGFYRWAMEHKDELMTLGPGRHFGEWWGQGIQGRYSIKEKRFSLFNIEKYKDGKHPSCCSVVPVLRTLPNFDIDAIHYIMDELLYTGSIASGFKEDKPEGVVLFHTHSNILYKKTFENDEAGKG